MIFSTNIFLLDSSTFAVKTTLPSLFRTGKLLGIAEGGFTTAEGTALGKGYLGLAE